MKKYSIFTDSSCDMSKDMIKEKGIISIPLSFSFDGDKHIYYDGEASLKDFYDRIRNGDVAKTSAANPEDFIKAFKIYLDRGEDILYLGFSSGLSTTYNSARLAADYLMRENPESKIITIDTLAASAGMALLIDLIIDKKNIGASIDEVAEFAERIKLNICHWFTVDDLDYLKRGGRISPTSAFFGNMLGIKPLLHVDNDGHLINTQKIRGRRLALETMAKKCADTIDTTFPRIAYISHADCYDDAETLKGILMAKYAIETKLITNVGAVIGAHSGPGTLALFFVGKER